MDLGKLSNSLTLGLTVGVSVAAVVGLIAAPVIPFGLAGIIAVGGVVGIASGAFAAVKGAKWIDQINEEKIKREIVKRIKEKGSWEGRVDSQSLSEQDITLSEKPKFSAVGQGWNMFFHGMIQHGGFVAGSAAGVLLGGLLNKKEHKLKSPLTLTKDFAEVVNDIAEKTGGEEHQAQKALQEFRKSKLYKPSIGGLLLSIPAGVMATGLAFKHATAFDEDYIQRQTELNWDRLKPTSADQRLVDSRQALNEVQKSL
jgi:hypothetical protein